MMHREEASCPDPTVFRYLLADCSDAVGRAGAGDLPTGAGRLRLRSFGVLARSAGMGVVAPIVMSATTFAGSAQFAAVSVGGAGGSVGAAVAAALLLNARYVPIGISVAPSLAGHPWRRFLLAQLTVDESWALAARGDGRFDLQTLAVAGFALFVAWISGTTIGVFGGKLLGDPLASAWTPPFPRCS